MHRMFLIGLTAAALGAASLVPAHAIENKTTGVTKNLRTLKLKPGVGGGTVGPVGGGTTVAELSAWECRQVGGTVVTVADDRCGASRKYCRMPDTNAVCIDELTD